jgi:cation-transporting ATPase I
LRSTPVEPQVLHELPGRLRLHAPGWSGSGPGAFERGLAELDGVERATASALTRNVLVRFDARAVDTAAILRRAAALTASPGPEAPAAEPPEPPAPRRSGTAGRVRLGVRGVERDPAFAARVEQRLANLAGVGSVRVSRLTGRALVELEHGAVAVEHLAAEIVRLEAEFDVEAEPPPADPVDPAALTTGAARLAGAAAALVVLLGRQTLGRKGPLTSSAQPAVAAALVSVAEGVPPLSRLTRGTAGDRLADVVLGSGGLVAQTLAGKTTGLAVAAGAALRTVTALRGRHAAWREYDQRTAAPPALDGARVLVASGDRAPADGVVLEGSATAVDREGMPLPAAPGTLVPAGARLLGGSVALELRPPEAYPGAGPRPSAPQSPAEQFASIGGALALGAAVVVGLAGRSASAALTTLQLLNPRAALHARQAAQHGAAARLVRAGVTVVGTRPDRRIERPDVVLLDGARLMTDGFELVRTAALTPELSASEVLDRAGDVAAATGWPWGRLGGGGRGAPAAEGEFDGRTATATLRGRTHRLTLVERPDEPGTFGLLLATDAEPEGIGAFVLRPRLAAGLGQLRTACARRGTQLVLLVDRPERRTAHALADRAGLGVLDVEDAVRAVRGLQRSGARVAVVSDSVGAGPIFDAGDLAIGVSSGRSGGFAARADLLAPDLTAVAATVDAGARAGLAERDGTVFAAAAAIAGAVWGLRGRPTIVTASRPATYGSAAALAAGWLRLQGGGRSRSVVSRLTDPRPERWGRMDPERVLRELDGHRKGLSSAQARARRRRPLLRSRSGALAGAVAGQARSPANAVLAGGAALSLSLGATGDILMIAAVIAANALIDAWQERRVDRAAQALERLTAAEARVLRDGAAVTLPADEVVPGDVLLLAAGDRIPADGRLLTAHELQVDEAALTGESLPVAKSVENGAAEHHIVLEGSDVTVGTARAVAIAVGHETRLGSIAAALDADDQEASPLAARLQRIMRQGVPLVLGAGALVAGIGVLRRRSATEQLAIGTSMAIAAVPEGLQLLSTVAAAGVARRLAAHGVLVRSLPAVDALGRVDVVCADKTGTLTLGRPAVRTVATLDAERRPGRRLPAELRDVLRIGAHASPHPDASDAGAHPTDVAVLEAADAAGLGELVRVRRERESPFDPARSFHAAVVGGRLCVKGAAEVIAPRCRSLRRRGAESPLDDPGELLRRADALAARGLRVLLVADGDPAGDPEDPRDLVAVGFLGIADPLRPGVDLAIARCREAGVRTLMLTGDHPATARAIAREAGLPASDGAVLSGPEIAELEPGELDRRLEGATVIARITPLDKLRIVESLQRRGHTVAMTGDGVNDAPALRLADVGIAMGRDGTQVARQASDIILTRDDFEHVTEAFVEGRGFWRNMRRAIGLLLGGNLGEVGLMVGAAVLGLPAPMTARQLLAVNLVTDVLPAMAVAMQPPEHRRLQALAREGTEALDAPLRTDILSRATVTALPSLAAYAVAVARLGARAAAGVGFGSICATQLVLTLADGRTDRGISRSVTGAVGLTGALLAAVLGAGPGRRYLGWDPLGTQGWALVGAATAGTAVLRGVGRGTGARLLGGLA